MTDSRNAQWIDAVTEAQRDGRWDFDALLDRFHHLTDVSHEPLEIWRPDEDRKHRSNLAQFAAQMGCPDYSLLHQWSVSHRAEFWQAVVARLGIVFEVEPAQPMSAPEDPLHPGWFPGATLNIVESCFTAEPSRPAIIEGGSDPSQTRTLSFGELEELVARVAGGLQALGFQPGDAIALYMPMTIECVAAYLGIIRAGCVAVSIADSFPATELASRLEIANARGVVTVDHFMRANKKIKLLDTVHSATELPAIVIDPPDSSDSLREDDVSWSDFLRRGQAAPPHFSDARAATNILFSSGTTGQPKAIPWTHLTPIKAAMDGHFHQDIRPGDRVAWPTNIGWMMGPWLIYASLINDATICLYTDVPSTAGFAEFVHRSKVTMLGVIPSLVRAWRSRPEFDQIRWPDLRVFSSTGEPSNRDDFLWLMSRADFQAPVIEYCGGTEIGGGYITGSVMQPASPGLFTTPALGLDFVILADGAEETAVGGMGEVFLIPPSIGLSEALLNRRHDAEYYEECPAGPRGEQLRRHGDQLMRLEGGYYRAQGRADDTMNLGGIKISSVEIETILNAHPALRECAAIAVQTGGEGVESLVIYAVAAGEADAAELRGQLGRLLSAELNPLFKIYDLILIDELPRTASNKLMRRRLRNLYSGS